MFFDGKYKTLRAVGTGTFGQVFEVEDLKNGGKFVAKTEK